MNKTLFTIPLILMGMLLVFSSTAIAHEGEDHGKEMYEEGSGGSSMEMGRGSRAMAQEYYEKKYGKYEHEKNKMRESGNTMMDEGSGMKEEAMRMKEMEHQRREEGSKM